MPWVASQMDIEAMDWALLSDKDENWMLVLDIHAEDKTTADAHYSGYRRSLINSEEVCGTCEVIENQTNVTEVFMFTSVNCRKVKGVAILFSLAAALRKTLVKKPKR